MSIETPMAYEGPLIDNECFPEAAEDFAYLSASDAADVNKERSGFVKAQNVLRRLIAVSGAAVCLSLLGGVLLTRRLYLGQFASMESGGHDRKPSDPSGALSSPPTLLYVEDWSEAAWISAFEKFYVEYNRVAEYGFGTDEYSRRFSIYKSNMEMIDAHNGRIHHAWNGRKLSAMQEEDETLYSVAPNAYTDLTFEEFQSTYMQADREMAPLGDIGWHLRDVANASLPREVNWHDRGCVTPVKNQAKCGSCWAFSSTGAVEGAICAQTGQLMSLSEQELVDCAGPEGEHGCNGGLMERAFQYVIDADGLCLEDDYPYKAAQMQCRRDKCKKAGRITGFMNIPPENDKALRAAVAFYGPVSAGIEADRATFQFYHNGVFSLPCGHHLNHAILITGYGHEVQSNQPYWLVKNSWGADWGDKGYIKLARKGRGKKGECGILLSPTVPLVGEPAPSPHEVCALDATGG